MNNWKESEQVSDGEDDSIPWEVPEVGYLNKILHIASL